MGKCVFFFFFFCFNKLVNVNLIGYEYFFLCNIECIKNYKDNINSIVESFLVICTGNSNFRQKLSKRTTMILKSCFQNAHFKNHCFVKTHFFKQLTQTDPKCESLFLN